MTIAIEPGEVIEKIHPDDRKLPEAKQTVWRFRVPDLRVAKLIKSANSPRVSASARIGPIGMRVADPAEMERMALKLCMEPPTGFLQRRKAVDEGGEVVPAEGFEEVPWETHAFKGRDDAPRDAYLSKVPPAIRSWLFNQIDEVGSVTEEEAGNS